MIKIINSMYDTLNLWLPTESIAEVDYIERIGSLIDNPTQHTKVDTAYLTGHFQGLKTSISDRGLSLRGSLCKYYLNDNIKTLTRQDTQRAIEKLSDDLGLPMMEASVNRIDLAQSFIMNHNTLLYYDYLGDCNHYKRLTQPQSIYYQNGLRTKLFYDKIAEIKKKKVVIPEIWFGQNVLRYEVRYTSRLPKQFNVNKVLAKTLFEEVFYMDLVDRWNKEYKSINKLKEIKMNFKKITSNKDFINQMAVLMINSIGQNGTVNLINQLKSNNCFKHKEYYSRLKADIKKLCKSYESDAENELMTELSEKINRIHKYCR